MDAPEQLQTILDIQKERKPKMDKQLSVPVTPKRVVTDDYHGIKVADEYQWLEDASDPAVQTWMKAQNDLARGLLDDIPGLPALREKLKALYLAESPMVYQLIYRGKKVFALKNQPPKQQRLLVMFSADLTDETVILDPNDLDPSGGTSIDWFVPSVDGKYVAVSLSLGGSEQGTAFVYEAATGKRLSDEIPRVQYPTGGGSITWNRDSSGFYYTRYPHVGERDPQDMNFYEQVYFHRLGAPAEEDTYSIGREFPRIAEIFLSTSRDGETLLAQVANGDGGEFAHYLCDRAGEWTQLTTFADQFTQASLGQDGYLYLLSQKNAPRRQIVRLSLTKPTLENVEIIVPQGENAIESFEVSATSLYVTELLGGPSQLRRIDLETRLSELVPGEPVSYIGAVLALEGDEVLIYSTSYITPPAWYRYRPNQPAPQRTHLFMTSPADFSDCEVVREFARSRDGTMVPVNIVRRKGIVLDGENPLLLSGYGGYGVSMTPSFRASMRIWLDAGGVTATANLRGGGEFGEEWHQAGNLTNKQNVFDDFMACAEHLIRRKYTNASKLAIEGASNGGLLMGAVLTQQPTLFRAVVSHVGIYDALRVELDPNGAFNVTEFGTVTNPAQFEALYDYSPYHRVVDGTQYPAVLLLTGENDGRVNPMHSRKMTARLQAAGSHQPILLRISTTSGHGIGTSLDEIIQIRADVFAFLFAQLNIEA
jgi:prolyl oligopeptidase